MTTIKLTTIDANHPTLLAPLYFYNAKANAKNVKEPATYPRNQHARSLQNMNVTKLLGPNSGLTKVMVQCSTETFGVNQSLAHRINISENIVPFKLNIILEEKVLQIRYTNSLPYGSAPIIRVTPRIPGLSSGPIRSYPNLLEKVREGSDIFGIFWANTDLFSISSMLLKK